MLINFKKHLSLILSLAFYLFLALVLTWPLLTNFSTHILGTPGDSPMYLWSQWWLKYSLTQGASPFDANLLAYPFGANLAFSALTATNGILTNLFLFFLPPIVAFNSFFIISLVLAALGAYLLLDFLVENKYAAFIGGAMFVFNAYVFSKIGHYNYASVYLIPFFLLFFIKVFSLSKKIKYVIGSGLVLALSFYNDYYYTIGLLIISALIGFWFIWKNKNERVANIKNWFLVYLLWLVLASPLLFLTIQGAWGGALPLARIEQIALYSPDIRSFFVPPPSQTFFGSYFIDYYKNLNFHASVVYPGYSLLILAVIGYFVGRKIKQKLPANFWLLVVLIFFFIVLGPVLYFKAPLFHLPYILFSYLPFVKGMLVPCRLVVFMNLGLITLAAFGLSCFFKKSALNYFSKLAIALAVAGVFIFENMLLPLPINKVSVPSVYQQIAADKEASVVLELPFALSTSFFTIGQIPSSAVLQYYQSVHHKKILGGWISRVPNSYPNFYSRVTGLDYLIDPKIELSKETLGQIKPMALANFNKLNISYVIVHPEYYNHLELRNTINFLNETLSIKPEIKDDLFLYKMPRK